MRCGQLHNARGKVAQAVGEVGIVRGLKLFPRIMAVGLTTFPSDLLIFCHPLVIKPCMRICFVFGSPADMSIACHMAACWRIWSFPANCKPFGPLTVPQNFSTCAVSSGQPSVEM